tara:strand:+ start:83 stop:298 length:216 start_codon:yes stop_codon:yes gene_type:complete
MRRRQDLDVVEKRTINIYTKIGSIIVSVFFIIQVLINIDILPGSFHNIGKLFLVAGSPLTFYGFYLYYIKK